jgi:hypothetical protein
MGHESHGPWVKCSLDHTRSSVGPDPSQFHRPQSWCSHMKRSLWESGFNYILFRFLHIMGSLREPIICRNRPGSHRPNRRDSIVIVEVIPRSCIYASQCTVVHTLTYLVHCHDHRLWQQHSDQSFGQWDITIGHVQCTIIDNSALHVTNSA